jgi:phosphoglycolate phosphatase-like HAD superfamily hydrolase
VALERAGVVPDDAVFVGDTVWDVRAAARAGVPCICVESGGIDRMRLEDEGAVAIFEDPRDLADRLDDSPIGRLVATASLRK